MKKVGKIIWVIALIAIIVLIGVVGFGYYKKATFNSQNPIVTMEVENFGTIKMELYPDQAPETVANFIALANRGFYDGTKFHRVVKDFMIQTGSKDGDGTTSAKISNLKDGGEDKEYSIKDFYHEHRGIDLFGNKFRMLNTFETFGLCQAWCEFENSINDYIENNGTEF